MQEQHPEFYDAYYVLCNDGLSPLTTIQGYADLLLGGYLGTLSQDQTSAIEHMRQATRKSMEVWRRGLVYLQTIQKPVQKHWISVIGFEKEIQYLSKEYHVDIHISSEGFPFELFCDARLLVIALHYLVYSPETIADPNAYKQPRVVITATSDCIIFHLRSAEYFPEGHAERVFDTPGTSLSIAQRILHAHDTILQIEPVESAYDFQVKLPQPATPYT